MLKRRLLAYAQLDLESIFKEFYDAMLSDEGFAIYFANDEQIKSLVIRQKRFLLDSIILEDDEIKKRYVDLGEMHYDIKIPYVDFLTGMGMLEHSITKQVGMTEVDGEDLLDYTFLFFKNVRTYVAKGYLNRMLESDLAEINLYQNQIQRAHEIDRLFATDCITWLKSVLFAIKIEDSTAEPARYLPKEITSRILSISKENPALKIYADEIKSRMEKDVINLFAALRKSSYEDLLPLYRELISIYKLPLMLISLETVAPTNTLAPDAVKDELTGLLPRHVFEKLIDRELSIAASGQYSLSFIMLDLDHFKGINDRFGEDAGDRVLRGVADAIGQAIRSTDYVFRYAGQVFLILLKGASPSLTKTQAEGIRQSIEGLAFNVNQYRITVTASAGLAVFSAPFDMTPSEMTLSAYKKLDEAKKNGRNCVAM